MIQALNDEMGQRPEEEATTMAMKLMRAIQPRAAQVKDWERVQAVLVAHTGKRGNIWCGDKLTAQEEWVTQWMNNLLHERHGGALLGGEVASSSSDAPAVLAEGEKPEDHRERLHEIQNQHDIELFEWHQRQSEKEAAEEARRREDATMAAHMGWSTRPAKKKTADQPGCPQWEDNQVLRDRGARWGSGDHCPPDGHRGGWGGVLPPGQA